MMRIAVLLAVLLLSSCANLRFPASADSAPEQRQAIDLLEYTQRVAAMPAERQRDEYGARDRVYAKEKDRMSRMRLALLLLVPGTSFHDPVRAASLLEPVALQEQAQTPVHTLARLLYAQLTALASEQKRASQMREQLDALKEIERTILDRAQESMPRHR